MCPASEGVEVHVNSSIGFVEKRQHQFEVVAAGLWDVDEAAVGGPPL